jgi:hypothetical protein
MQFRSGEGDGLHGGGELGESVADQEELALFEDTRESSV